MYISWINESYIVYVPEIPEIFWYYELTRIL